MRVTATEFAHGGYAEVQKTLGKAINEQISEQLRANKDADFLNWIDAGSSAEVNGAAYSHCPQKPAPHAPRRRVPSGIPREDASPNSTTWFHLRLPTLSYPGSVCGTDGRFCEAFPRLRQDLRSFEA